MWAVQSWCLHAVELVVVLVPVVHDDRAVQVAVDEGLEGGQVPVAEEVIGEQVRARDVQVFLLRLGAGAGPQRGLVAADDAGQDEQRPDRLVRRGHGPGGAAQQGVHPPVGRPGPGHRLQDVRAAFDRDMVYHHQEHAPGLEVQPVGDGSRRPGRLRRGVGDVPPAAGAFHLVPVVLGGLRPGFGQVGDLVGVRHPEVPRAGEAAAALAPALREHVLGLVRAGVPRQVCPRRARLLARLPLVPGAAAGLALRGLLPGQVIRRGRHRGVPAVAGQRTFQPRHLLPQRRDLVSLRAHRVAQLPDQLLLRRDPLITGCAGGAIRGSRRQSGHRQ